MPEPFQYVQQAEKLRSEQRYREAENAFRRALEGYERAKDMDGIAYTLGRIGAAYEQSGEASKAIDAYQRAVQIGTDLPAIYHSLIILLVERNQLDEAFTVAGQWQLHGQAHLAGPAHDIFIEIGARLVRDKHFDTAVAVLARAVEVLSVQTYPEEHWKARGVLALAYEKAGDSDTAMRLCAEAIDSGSSDRQTYARYVMFLERQKRYDDALTAVRRGQKVQRDVAWEADLRQRQQRIERKAGKLDKDAAPAIIPMFSVRRGSKSIVLLHQIKLSPQLTDLAVGGQGLAYTVSGGQKPKLSAWRLEDASLAWQVDLPEVAAGVLLARDTLVTYAREGRIGEGSTTLRFYDLAGNTLATQRLPDVVSEVVAREGMVYTGCRDGRLYAFTSQGRSEWFFEVPGSTDQLESASMRPCPYS
jgi:tetratricopeptide (TPR) repeat protein